jgi:hypothetical protein
MTDEIRIPVGDIVTGWGERVGARRVRLGRMPEEARKVLLVGGRVILTGCPPARSYGPTERIVRKRGRYWMAMVPSDGEEVGNEEEELLGNNEKVEKSTKEKR